MLETFFEKSFLNDYKILKKKHYKMEKIDIVISLLQTEQTLPKKYRNHSLKGNLQGLQDCHIEDNLVLIYKIDGNKLILSRVNTHDSVF